MEAGVFPVDLQEEGVQFRGFGRPGPHARQGVGGRGQLAGEIVDGVGDRFSVLVEKLIEDLGAGFRPHFQLEDALGQRGIQGGDEGSRVETTLKSKRTGVFSLDRYTSRSMPLMRQKSWHSSQEAVV